MSTAEFGARPHRAEARVKPVIPMRNVRRWPKRSPKRPPTTSREPSASAYAEPSHLMSNAPPPRVAAMVGAAIIVSVESIRSSASASTTAIRISHIVRVIPTARASAGAVILRDI
jgi:hypothetical protein